YGTHNVETEAVCGSFVWHDSTYTQSGTYTYDYTNAEGCPSTDTLYLTVHYGTHNVETEAVCGSFVWHVTTYTQSGTYTYDYSNADGCPSTDTLYLTVHYGTHNVETEAVCGSFVWHDSTYTQSGTYTYEYSNNYGCTSVDTLHLTITFGTNDVQDVTACESYVWHGMTYTQSGTYTYLYIDAYGCTCVDTLHLIVGHGDHNVQTETVCESIVWHGTTYTQSGSYIYDYTNDDGCPSADTLHLTVVERPQLTEIQGPAYICKNQFATYYYNTSDNSYHYSWIWKGLLYAENTSSVILHEMTSGTSLLSMQVADYQNICLSETSLGVTVGEHYAPDTTVIIRKASSNILVCQPVHSEYGVVHYRWGYTNRDTHEEFINEDSHYTYTQYVFGIDTLAYEYWVETYITYEDGESCANRTYYGYNHYPTGTDSFDADVVEAYINGDRIVVFVNTAVPSEVNAAVYNVNGKLLLTRAYGFTDIVTDVIPLSAATGVYFLKITTGKRLHTFKLIKM
ncbi:MAG: T9SS type A sorting domain-containing protein, partial [Paludibacteraceae bacterium]|nr:T9SS type A sorting domain-containing protein [Paludibacteraceae bacterium]